MAPKTLLIVAATVLLLTVVTPVSLRDADHHAR
jgi:hypothetical protein